jgi:hypothetical protein
MPYRQRPVFLEITGYCPLAADMEVVHLQEAAVGGRGIKPGIYREDVGIDPQALPPGYLRC